MMMNEVQFTSTAFLWNILLTGGYAALLYFLRGKLDELKAVQTLLTITREEIARDSIPRKEFNESMRLLNSRLDELVKLILKNRGDD